MLADFRHAYGLRSVCLRYFNAAGAPRWSNWPRAITPRLT